MDDSIFKALAQVFHLDCTGHLTPEEILDARARGYYAAYTVSDPFNSPSKGLPNIGLFLANPFSEESLSIRPFQANPFSEE